MNIVNIILLYLYYCIILYNVLLYFIIIFYYIIYYELYKFNQLALMN